MCKIQSTVDLFFLDTCECLEIDSQLSMQSLQDKEVTGYHHLP